MFIGSAAACYSCIQRLLRQLRCCVSVRNKSTTMCKDPCLGFVLQPRTFPVETVIILPYNLQKSLFLCHEFSLLVVLNQACGTGATAATQAKDHAQHPQVCHTKCSFGSWGKDGSIDWWLASYPSSLEADLLPNVSLPTPCLYHLINQRQTG